MKIKQIKNLNSELNSKLSINPDYIDFINNISNPTYLEGRLFYNYTTKSISYYSDDTDIIVNIGIENLISNTTQSIYGDKTFANNLTVTGDLTVNGTNFITNTEVVQVEDNMILVNYGEIGSGVTKSLAGLRVDRGTADDFAFLFDEVRDKFVVGTLTDETAPSIAALQVVATREDTPLNNGFARWDSGTNKFLTQTLSTGDVVDSLNKRYVTDVDLTVLSNTSNTNTGDQIGSTIELSKLGSATYTTVQDMQDMFHSAGNSSGGEITDVGAGQITVSAGTGYIRPTNNKLDTLYTFDYPALSATSVTDGIVSYIKVSYNSGTPTISVSLTDSFNNQDEFILGIAIREGTTVHTTTNSHNVGDHAGMMIERVHQAMGIQRDKYLGGLILGQSGDANRYVTLSTGALWSRLNRYPISAINTNPATLASTYDRYYQNGVGGFTKESPVTQFNNSLYDDGTGTLAAIGVNKYANIWFYLELDGGLVAQYGRGTYATLALAQAGAPPTSYPARLSSEHAILIGRLIIKQGDNVAVIQTIFDTVFNVNGIINHNDTGSLNVGDYLHLTAAQFADRATLSGAQTFTGAKTFQANTLLKTGTELVTNLNAQYLNSVALQASATAATGVMQVGAFGLGADVLALTTDADALTRSGRYAVGSSWTGSPIVGVNGSNQGYIEHSQWTATNYAKQEFISVNSTKLFYFRRKELGVWGTWTIMHHNANSNGATFAWNTAALGVTGDATISGTVKIASLTDGYIPYHQTDAIGLVNSVMRADSNAVAIGGNIVASQSLSIIGSVGNVQFESTGAALNFTRANLNYITAGVVAGELVLTVNGIGKVTTGSHLWLKANGDSILSAGNVGIGTTLPLERVHSIGNIRTDGIATPSIFKAIRINNTAASPTAVVSANVIGQYNFGGQYSTTIGQTQTGGLIRATATENWSTTAAGTKLELLVTANTTLTNVVALTLNQDLSAEFASSLKTDGALVYRNTATTLPSTTGAGNIDIKNTANYDGTLTGNVTWGVTNIKTDVGIMLNVSVGTYTINLAQTGVTFIGDIIAGVVQTTASKVNTIGLIPITATKILVAVKINQA